MHYKKYKQALEKYARDFDMKNCDNFFYLVDEIFSGSQHNMFVGKEELFKQTFDDFSDLEKADLIDYFSMESDGRNKKR